MASGLSCVVVFALCLTLAPCVSGGSDCESYTDSDGFYQAYQTCYIGFCCGDCSKRYCCQNTFYRFREDQQEDCIYHNSALPLVFGIGSLVAVFLIFICCCICPCCCLYKMCRKPAPVIATTTVVTSTAQHYPQQQTAAAGPQYAPYQPVPVQPGYGTQPPPQGYGVQPMATSPYHGQSFTVGPPPTYQEATGPTYPPNPMPYSQAAFSPGQPPYPLQPPAQPQPLAQASAPPTQIDFLAQPAFNPDYVAPPPKMG